MDWGCSMGSNLPNVAWGDVIGAAKRQFRKRSLIETVGPFVDLRAGFKLFPPHVSEQHSQGARKTKRPELHLCRGLLAENFEANPSGKGVSPFEKRPRG